MREKLNSLSLTELRAIAASKSIPRVTTLRKQELIDKLLELYEQEKAQEKAQDKPADSTARTEEPASQPAPVRRVKRTYTRTNSEPAPVSVQEAPAYRETREPQPAKDPQTAKDTQANRDVQPVREPSRNDSSRNETYRTDSSRTEAYRNDASRNDPPRNLSDLDSGEKASGFLEVIPDGFGFIRSSGFMTGEDDIYVAPSQIKRFRLKTGDIVSGSKRIKSPTEKFSALLYIDTINGMTVSEHAKIVPFENLTPIFPHERLHLETPDCAVSMRITDLLCPIGKGQRGLIVAQPKVGKTTLLKQIAQSLLKNHPDLFIIVLLIDERPEEVTDMKETVVGDNVEVVYSTFDEQPEHHKRVSEMIIERAKRLVEMKKDVVILLDSITRMTRAYNLTITSSGRTLSGGLDPASLYMPKRFFGAARCMREGGSLTILATALVETGSRLDDVVYEEFKGTGNMELVLNRKLSERRIFPAIDIMRSSTRRDDLLLTPDELEAAAKIHKVTGGMKAEESTEQILDLFAMTKTNAEFVQKLKYVVFN